MKECIMNTSKSFPPFKNVMRVKSNELKVWISFSLALWDPQDSLWNPNPNGPISCLELQGNNTLQKKACLGGRVIPVRSRVEQKCQRKPPGLKGHVERKKNVFTASFTEWQPRTRERDGCFRGCLWGEIALGSDGAHPVPWAGELRQKPQGKSWEFWIGCS